MTFFISLITSIYKPVDNKPINVSLQSPIKPSYIKKHRDQFVTK